MEYKELLVAKLMDNPMERRKCAATVLRAGKQEGFKSTRCDTFDSTYEDDRLEKVIENGGDDATNRPEKQWSKESESRAELLCSPDKEKPQPKENNKRRTSQEIFSAFHKAPTRLGCGFRVDQMALNFVLQRIFSR